MVSSTTIESLLAIDVGSINTRAFLFDIAEGAYRFVASGVAPSTADAAFGHNVETGISQAIDQLNEITGRVFYSDSGRLILPSQSNGMGVDALVTTLSAGPSIRTIVVGLLEDVSLESAQRLAATTYTQIVESIGLADQRNAEMQIDTIIQAKPDLVIVAGGTNNGASRSVMKLMEVVGLACHLLPEASRPEVIFAGNQMLGEKVKAMMEPLTITYCAPNIRPSFTQEDLNPAQEALNKAIVDLRLKQLKGVKEISEMAGKEPELSSTAFGRVVRFLNKAYDGPKGVLGIDLGASTCTIAAACDDKLSLYSASLHGMGEGIASIQSPDKLDELMNWMPITVTPEYVQEYVYNKPLHPASLPVSLEDLSIEQAAARQVLRAAMNQASQRYPEIGFNAITGLAPMYEPILVSGAVFTQAPTYGQAMLMLLDGILPTGVTTFVLDQNNLGAVLGAAGTLSPLLPVQVLESNAILNLGTVISPVSHVRIGSTIMMAHLWIGEGTEDNYEIKQGSLTVLPIQKGQKARLQLEMLHDTDLGLHQTGSKLVLNIVGGALGAIIDARGRPLIFPADMVRRREWVRKWLWTLGG